MPLDLCSSCSISTVYKATCNATKDQVIIKAYDKSKMKPKNTARMEREIKLMRLLTGDGLVSLFGVFEEPGYKLLVMELCKGGDLFKLLLMKGGVLEEHWVCVEVSSASQVPIRHTHAVSSS